MAIEKVSILQAINAAQPQQRRPLTGEVGGPQLQPLHAENANLSKQLRNGPAVPTEEDRIKKAATDFEALLLQQMMKSMWTSMAPQEDGAAPAGQESKFYRDMLNEQVSKDIAEKQSLGIKEILAADMRKRGRKIDISE